MRITRQIIRRTTLTLAAVLTAASLSPIQATTVSTVPMNDISSEADGIGPIGDGSTSTIIRDPGGVTINVHTNIEPGAYTVWLLVWNDPSRCTNVGSPGCLPPAGGGSDIPDSVVFGTGQVVPASGRGGFAVHLPVGDTDRLIVGGLEQIGLTNALGAEIHVILRHHGPALADGLEAQITTPGGGCDVNECADLQGAAHGPGVGDVIMQLDAKVEVLQQTLDANKATLDRVAARNGVIAVPVE